MRERRETESVGETREQVIIWLFLHDMRKEYNEKIRDIVETGIMGQTELGVCLMQCNKLIGGG